MVRGYGAAALIAAVALGVTGCGAPQNTSNGQPAVDLPSDPMIARPQFDMPERPSKGATALAIAKPAAPAPAEVPAKPVTESAPAAGTTAKSAPETPPAPAASAKPVIEAATMPAAAIPPKAPPLPTLVGMERAKVIAELGRPKMTRRDGSAEVMTFITPECALFVFLYDRPNGASQVRHIEARARPGRDGVPQDTCIGGIISRGRPAAANPA